MDLNQALLLIVLAGAALGVTLAAWTLARLASALTASHAGKTDDLLAASLRGPLALLAGLLAAAVGLALLAPRLDADIVVQSRRLLVGLFFVAGAWGILRVLRVGLQRAGERHARFQPASRVASRLAALVVYTLAFLMVLSAYGVSITPVLTGLGIAGLAVALALQDTGANFFAGVWIQTGKALQPTHYVRIEGEQGLEGYVEEVGWRVTRVRTLGGNTIVVPNNKLAQSIVTDFDLPAKNMSVVMSFRSELDADPRKVVEILVEEAKAAYQELPKSFHAANPPFAQLSDFEEYAMRFSLIIRVPEFVQQWNAQDLVRKRVLARFAREGIRIPYPTRHNYQEPAQPREPHDASAPGGPAPGRRPPRPRPEAAPSEDPRAIEADRTRQEIVAQQSRRRHEAEQATGP